MFNAEFEKEMEDGKEGRIMVRFIAKHKIKLEMEKNINI